jgi:hypothetical protein
MITVCATSWRRLLLQHSSRVKNIMHGKEAEANKVP